jgi:hypothetical protein
MIAVQTRARVFKLVGTTRRAAKFQETDQTGEPVEYEAAKLSHVIYILQAAFAGEIPERIKVTIDW